MRSAVHPNTHPARTQNLGFGGTLISCFALAYAVAWSLWIPLAIFRDRVPSPLGFVLLAVLQRTSSGRLWGARPSR